MSFGVALRNSLAIGLGGIVSLFAGRGNEQSQSNLLCENGDNLVQQDGGFILV
jgi:hypothetical protein